MTKKYFKEWEKRKMKKRSIMAFLVRLVVLAVVAYGAWHVFCRYYPSVIRRLSGAVSAEIVDNEYRFGDVNSTHLTAAQKNGIKPVSSRDELKTDKLVKIESCDEYMVERLTHSVPYLTKSTAELLSDIGTRFQKELKEQGFEKHRIVVTSVLRTGEDAKRLRKVNGNASENSAHQYGTTFDITYVRYDRQSLFGKSASEKQLAKALGTVLKQLRNEGYCYVKYERKQRCFHITSRK